MLAVGPGAGAELGGGLRVERLGVVEDGPGIFGELLGAGRTRFQIDGRPIV